MTPAQEVPQMPTRRRGDSPVVQGRLLIAVQCRVEGCGGRLRRIADWWNGWDKCQKCGRVQGESPEIGGVVVLGSYR